MTGKKLLVARMIQADETSRSLAEKLGIRVETFRIKLNTNAWKANEILLMIDILGLTRDDVMDIFFFKNSTNK